MTAAQWAVLYVLADAGAAGMHRSTVEAHVGKADLGHIGIETKNPFTPLERAKLIELILGTYRITDKGRDALRRLHRHAIRALQESNIRLTE